MLHHNAARYAYDDVAAEVSGSGVIASYCVRTMVVGALLSSSGLSRKYTCQLIGGI